MTNIRMIINLKLHNLLNLHGELNRKFLFRLNICWDVGEQKMILPQSVKEIFVFLSKRIVPTDTNSITHLKDWNDDKGDVVELWKDDYKLTKLEVDRWPARAAGWLATCSNLPTPHPTTLLSTLHQIKFMSNVWFPWSGKQIIIAVPLSN